MDELKPCPLCGWCDGKHLPTTVDNKTEPLNCADCSCTEPMQEGKRGMTMLTKEQILSKMRGFDCPKYLTESCWQPIYDQCVAAIDLAAENERLKAKLDEIKELAEEMVRASQGLSGYWACSANIYCRRIVAIIDKDGDET